MAENGIFEAKTFVMQCGSTLSSAFLSYRTHGKLNADKSNAIMFPGFLGGIPEALELWIGEGRPLDPAKYFIILPGQFGIPPSSSPSNTPAPYNGAHFPQARIADDIIIQERMMRELFGITELQLVLGWSVGALQTYEWAVRFPSKVKRMASIAGAPKPSAWTKLWLKSVVEEPLTTDPFWANGNYTDNALLQAGKRQIGHLAALTLPPKIFYRVDRELWRTTMDPVTGAGFASVNDFVARFWESFWLPHDANDLVLQSRKAQLADPAEGGNIADALAKITAKAAVAALTGDAMFPPDEGAMDAKGVKGAEFSHLESDSGHLATFSLTQNDRVVIDAVIARILSR